MTKIIMPSGRIITPDSLFVRHRFARNSFDVETPKVELEGRYQMTVRRADGSIKQETPWFKNLITDAGLDRWFSGQSCFDISTNGIKVGTGTTAPANNQTTLVARVASSSATASGGGIVVAAGAPWWAGCRYAARFNAGQLNGQALTEVGIGWDSTACFSRALITPDGINPAAITVLADESLDVVYEIRVYPNTSDTTGTITLAGQNFDFVCRPASINNAGSFGFGSPAVGSLSSTLNVGQVSATTIAWRSGTLGAITGDPSGTDSVQPSGGAPETPSVGSYTNGSYQRQHSLLWSLTSMNSANGPELQVFLLSMHRAGRFQYRFNNPIIKGPTRTLRLDFLTSIARRP